MRRLRDTPGFTVIALASLALAIGLNVLIFAFTSPVLVKSLPYPDADRLLDVSMAPPGRPESRSAVTPGLYVILRDKTSAAFEAIGVFDAGRTANLAGDASGVAERLAGHRISATGLAALGATPLHGRLPVAADEQSGAPATMVLGYELWQKRFGGRADVVNQTVSVDGQPTLIIGVMPEGFGLLDNSSDAWFTYGFEPPPGQETQHNLRGIGRLKPGVSIAEAQAAVKVALDEYALTYPNRDKGWTVELAPWDEARFGGLRRPLLMVQSGVGAILLLLCVSLAVSLAARTRAASAQSIPTRSSTSGVLGQGVRLAIGGGAIGTVLVALGLSALRTLTPNVLPRLSDVSFDFGVIFFAILISILAGLVIGLVPALRAPRPGATLPRAYGWGGRLGATLFVALVAVQVALAFVLLAGAGLGVRAFNDLSGRDIGINPAGLLAFDVYLPRSPFVTPNVAQAGSIDLSEYPVTGPALFDRVRAALQTAPGVVQAAGVASQPFSNAPFVQFWIDDAEHTPDMQVSAQFLAVTENYFNTMGFRLVSGRDFAATDRPDSPWVVLVNETLAKQQWPDGNAIGRKVTLTFHPDDGEPSREVIGVVADALPFRGASEVPPLMYILHRQQALQQRASLEGRRTVMSFVAKTTGDPMALEGAIRPLVKTVDVTTPVTAIRTVESYANGGQVALFNYAKTLLGIFAIVALVTSGVGAYALTALGAVQRRKALTLTLRVVVAVALGVAAGRIIWLRLGSVIESFLTNLTVTPSDPAALVVAGGVILATSFVALVAASLGGYRAGR